MGYLCTKHGLRRVGEAFLNEHGRDLHRRGPSTARVSPCLPQEAVEMHPSHPHTSPLPGQPLPPALTQVHAVHASPTCPSGSLWPAALSTPFLPTLCPPPVGHCLGLLPMGPVCSHLAHPTGQAVSRAPWAQESLCSEDSSSSAPTTSGAPTVRRPLTSTAGLGAGSPLLQGPLIGYRVVFQDIVAVHVERVLMDHILVCQRDPGISLWDDLCPETAVKVSAPPSILP